MDSKAARGATIGRVLILNAAGVTKMYVFSQPPGLPEITQGSKKCFNTRCAIIFQVVGATTKQKLAANASGRNELATASGVP